MMGLMLPAALSEQDPGFRRSLTDGCRSKAKPHDPWKKPQPGRGLRL